MNILCKSATQVPGIGVVSKGQRILWHDGEEFPPQVLCNFVEAETGAELVNAGRSGTEDGTTDDGTTEDAPTPEQVAAEKARAEKVAREELLKRTAELGREKLESALDAAGVPHKAKMPCMDLAKLLLRNNGEDVD